MDGEGVNIDEMGVQVKTPLDIGVGIGNGMGNVL